MKRRVLVPIWYAQYYVGLLRNRLWFYRRVAQIKTCYWLKGIWRRTVVNQWHRLEIRLLFLWWNRHRRHRQLRALIKERYERIGW